MSGRAVVDLAGKRFGRLVVLSLTPREQWTKTGGLVWRCICDCGKEALARGGKLKDRSVRSCGCLRRDLAVARTTTHGRAYTAEYAVYRAMINRCHNEKAANFRLYGERGIAVCDRWRFGEGGKSGFECFHADMGDRPAPDLSIDRRNNDGNYEPGNCRWATRSEQAKNRRHWRTLQ